MKPVAILLPIVLLTGCATTGAQRDAAPAAPSPAAAAPTPSAPPAPQEGDLLFNLMLADIATQRGDYKTAVEFYTAAARETGNAQLAQHAARAALFGQNLDAAIPAAEVWRDLDPADPDPYQLLAILHLERGDAGAARQNLRELLARGDFSTSADYINLARFLSREGARESLMMMMDELLAARPDDSEAMYAYIVVAVRVEALEQAARVSKQLVAARPDWPEAVLAHAQVLELQEDRPAAVTALSAYLDRHPDSRDVRLARARLRVDLKDYTGARADFERLYRDRPDDADALLALALVDLQLEDTKAARKRLLSLAELPGQTDRAHFYLGRVAEAADDRRGAIGWYEQVRDGEHRLDAVVRRAELLALLGELEAARKLLHAESADDQATHARLLLAETNLLVEAGRYAAAEQVVNRGLAQYPDDIDLLFARSLVLDKLNRLAAMEADLRRILALDPDNAHALNAWGYTLADRGVRLEEAHELIQRALKLAPDNPYILDSMGWVLHRMGRSEEALAYLRRSLAMLPDAEVYAHLGEVLRALGRTDEARATVAKGLESDPQDLRLLGIQRLLSP